MLLTRLELSGFKSFVDKTELDFPVGITAVVGPNGSGKSNIIDAIRWLLGERDAKNIRGSRVEDLIFAGTPRRPRVGLATARMTFDNSSKFFPTDFTEVTVSRRVARDGNSAYFLNEAEVRLKDLVAFFAGSRLGTRGLTIINQGSSDIFVRATPKERRAMIEEILGLRQYQLKKHEAERRLVTTNFNLEKARAMIDELMPHLRLLRRQAARFEKQAEVQSELKELEKQYFGFKLARLAEERALIKPRRDHEELSVQQTVNELRELEQDLKKIEAAGPKNDASFDEHKKKRGELLNRRSEMQKSLGRLEAKIEFMAGEPKTELSSRRAVALLKEIRAAMMAALSNQDFSAVKVVLKTLNTKIDEALSGESDETERALRELQSESNDLAKELAGLDEALEELQKTESQFTGQLESFNLEFRKAFEKVEAKRRVLGEYEKEIQKLKFEEERITMRAEELKNTARQAGRDIDNFVAIPEKLIDLEDCEKRMFRLRAELAGIGELDESLIKEAQETETRYNFLSGQIEDLEKASLDLKALIRDLDEKLHTIFTGSLKNINDQFNHFFRLMFGGGRGHLRLVKSEPKPMVKDEATLIEAGEEITAISVEEESDAKHAVDHGGIEVDLSIPRKKIQGLDMLSGGERSLVSIAALFALISVSPPPFLVLDEVDAALDEGNARRFASIVKDFSKKTQFIIVTHNRATMEAADILYGVTMGEDGTSKVLSLKLDNG